ncbi:MAG: DNA replication licensing factor mcm8 [Paramarteilia canceri]
MLQSVCNVSPKSVYVCGNSTTQSGMTVTLNKDSNTSGDYSLEAGALVLADQGICCIDELDKMSTHHSSLLETLVHAFLDV